MHTHTWLGVPARIHAPRSLLRALSPHDLEAASICVSMDGHGRPWDNVFICLVSYVRISNIICLDCGKCGHHCAFAHTFHNPDDYSSRS